MGNNTHKIFFVSPEIAFLYTTMMHIDKVKFLELLGNQIKTLRKEKGLSLRQLAQLCDIDYSDISKIEKGQRNIQISTILELTKGLDIHPKDLFDFDIENLK